MYHLYKNEFHSAARKFKYCISVCNDAGTGTNALFFLYVISNFFPDQAVGGEAKGPPPAGRRILYTGKFISLLVHSLYHNSREIIREADSLLNGLPDSESFIRDYSLYLRAIHQGGLGNREKCLSDLRELRNTSKTMILSAHVEYLYMKTKSADRMDFLGTYARSPWSFYAREDLKL